MPAFTVRKYKIFLRNKQTIYHIFNYLAHALLQITQAMSQHHHKQNYMWLNMCGQTEKIILA